MNKERQPSGASVAGHCGGDGSYKGYVLSPSSPVTELGAEMSQNKVPNITCSFPFLKVRGE